MYFIGLVTGDNLSMNWQTIRPLVKVALETAQGELTAQDVLEKALKGEMQVWAVMQELCLVAVATTEVINYPRKNALRVVTIGGSRMEEWREQLASILRRYAEYYKATTIEAFGRPGLSKQLRSIGFKPAFVAYKWDFEPFKPSFRDEIFEEVIASV